MGKLQGKAAIVTGATSGRLVETCRRAFGGVDVAVCCAGMLGGLGSASDVPVETWRQTIAVNLDAVFYLMRFALPEMRQRGTGSFVVGIKGTSLTVDGGIMTGA